MAVTNANIPLIVLELIHGPLDGLRVESASGAVYIGLSKGVGPHGSKNDLVLDRDSTVSRFHAQVKFDNGKVLLSDLGSSNGTAVAPAKSPTVLGKQSPPVALEPGDLFVIGSKNVIAYTSATRNLPVVDHEAQGRLSLASRTIFARAQATPSGAQSWFGVEALFRELATSDAAPLVEFFANARLLPADALEMLKNYNEWVGDRAWVAERINIGLPEAMPAAPQATPRIWMLLTVANQLRENTAAQHIEPIHLLAAIFKEGCSRVARALSANGHAASALFGAAEKVLNQTQIVESRPPTPAPKEIAREEPVTQPPARRPSAESPPPAPEPPAAPPKPAPPPRRPLDPELWLLARELMDRLQTLQVEYHLAEPGVRFEALCGAIREGLQKAPPTKRGAMIELLCQLFPLLEDALAPPPPVAGLELANFSGESGTDRHGESEATPPAAVVRAESDSGELGQDTGKLLQEIYGGAKQQMMTVVGGDTEGRFLRLSNTLYRFVLEVEAMIKSLVQDLEGSGGSESRYYFPDEFQDLKMMVQKIVESDDGESLREIRRYLDNLQFRILALTTSQRAVVGDWNNELWEQISPESIRKLAKSRAGNMLIPVGKADLWQAFETVARDLKPDVTEDMFKHKVRQRFYEEFRRLTSRGKTGNGGS